jgi:hypothetical protein
MSIAERPLHGREKERRRSKGEEVERESGRWGEKYGHRGDGSIIE